MKLRTGFVSNSSTTSFCIYGCEMKEDEVKKILEDNGITIEESEDEYPDYSLYGEELEKKTGLELIIDSECEVFWIGRSWTSIGDDETGRQFKESVESKLPGKKCQIIQEEIAS